MRSKLGEYFVPPPLVPFRLGFNLILSTAHLLGKGTSSTVKLNGSLFTLALCLALAKSAALIA